MSKFVVAIFEDESKAYEGVSAFNVLHQEGSITLYGTIVVQRDEGGKVATKQRTPEAEVGTGLGSLLGAVIGVLGGPAGAAIGLAAGGLAGGLGGYVHGQVSDEFLEDVTHALEPGMFAVLAEVSEPWTAPVDTRIEALGGEVLREERKDVVDDVIEKRTAAQRAWLDEKKAARRTHKAQDMQASLDEDIEDARGKLQRIADKARQRLDQTKQEMEDKLKTLQEQGNKAKPEVKKEIDERIAEVRNQFREREQKLTQAYDIAQQALQP
jgi:uncharacterized membrane protein